MRRWRIMFTLEKTSPHALSLIGVHRLWCLIGVQFNWRAHIVVFNWRAQIVVLSHMGKEEMDEEIANRITERRGSTIIVRKGDAMSQADLMNISCPHAR